MLERDLDRELVGPETGLLARGVELELGAVFANAAVRAPQRIEATLALALSAHVALPTLERVRWLPA